MRISDHAGQINQHLRRHPAQLERLDLLSIQFLNSVFRIRQPDKREIFLPPVFLKRFGLFRADNEYLRIQGDEALIIPAQLCQMPAAERSGKTAVENQQHIHPAGKIRKGNGVAVKIRRSEIRCLLVELDPGHNGFLTFSFLERRRVSGLLLASSARVTAPCPARAIFRSVPRPG